MGGVGGVKAALLTSNRAGPQQVHNVHVVSKVTENLQLRHQRLLLRGVSVGCGDSMEGFYLAARSGTAKHASTFCGQEEKL